MNRGTYVSRSIYQKVVEENRKLRRDLKTLSCAPVAEAFKLRVDYRRKFRHEEEMNALIRKAALDYGKAHPELRVHVPGYNFCDHCGGAFKSSDAKMRLCPTCYS